MTKDIKKEATKEAQNLPEMEAKTNNEMVITVKGEEGRMYSFHMPFYAPLPECYNASVNAANEIARLFNEAVEKKKAEEAKEDKKETPEETK